MKAGRKSQEAAYKAQQAAREERSALLRQRLAEKAMEDPNGIWTELLKERDAR